MSRSIKIVLIAILFLVFLSIFSQNRAESHKIDVLLDKYSEILPGKSIPNGWNCYTYFGANVYFYCSHLEVGAYIFIYGADYRIQNTMIYLDQSISLGDITSEYGRWLFCSNYGYYTYWKWENIEAHAPFSSSESSLFTPIKAIRISQ